MKYHHCKKLSLFLPGSRRGSLEPGRGSHGGPGLPALHQDQHVLVGENSETQFQKEKISDQITPRRIRKLFDYKNTKFIR
jgi:hypothetical protein